MLHPKRRSELPKAAKPLQPFPFTLACQPSLIPAAGHGVFLQTTPSSVPIVPGTIVALYPGILHLKEHLQDRAYFRALLPDRDFMIMTRYDQYLIDGRTADQCAPNPFALAHKINHCGKQKRPNVMQIAFDFPHDFLDESVIDNMLPDRVVKSFPEELRQYIPNKYAKQPSLAGRVELAACCMKGLVMVAARPIHHNDEILMDYKLNPDAPDLPSWYESYDEDNSRSRWNEKDEF
jgi:hypothetical protein